MGACFFLSGCGSIKPFSLFSGSDTQIVSEPTKGGDINLKFENGKLDVNLKQPENTKEASNITLSGMPMQVGVDANGSPIYEKQNLTINLSGSTEAPPVMSGTFGGFGIIKVVGALTVLGGLIMIILSQIPYTRIIIHSWKWGAMAIGGGFGIIMASNFFEKYQTQICIGVLITLAYGFYTHRQGLLEETPEFLKKKTQTKPKTENEPSGN
jgi:hypothetical protein